MDAQRTVQKEVHVLMVFVLVGLSGQVQLVISQFVHTIAEKMVIVMLNTINVFAIQLIQVKLSLK